MNPHGPRGPTDFHTLLRLSPPPTAFAMGFGVWTIPSPCPDLAPGDRCCPSSLYTFPAVSGRAWLGIAMLQGSPNLSSSASPVSRRALKFSLKSGAYSDSATPAWFQRSASANFAGPGLVRKTAHKTHTELAFPVLCVLCVLCEISKLLKTQNAESFNSVPGHHIFNHLALPQTLNLFHSVPKI